MRLSKSRRGAAQDRRRRDDPHQGEADTGDIVNAVRHMRAAFGGIRRLQSLREEEYYSEAKELAAPHEYVKWVAENGRLPVVTFTAGGIATPADAALHALGADGVFVGSRSSRARSLPFARKRSSRRQRTTTTPRSSPACRFSASRCAASAAALPRASKRAAGRPERGGQPLGLCSIRWKFSPFGIRIAPTAAPGRDETGLKSL